MTAPEPTTKGKSREPSSFRDPSGHLYVRDGVLLRQVSKSFAQEFKQFIDSGLYAELAKSDRVVRHEERPLAEADDADAVAVIRPDRLATISYPYEWCFGQLQDAALATLDLQRRALEKGMALKDASAYNIQFRASKPVLIDTLSFEPYREGEPWVAYRQFCQHFLGPLALAAWIDPRLIRMLEQHLDGIPLDLVSKMLPRRTRWNLALGLHIHAHARLQSSSGTPSTAHRATISRAGLLGLIDNLESAVKRLQLPAAKTTWSDYYDETNYSDQSMAEKRAIVSSMLDVARPALVWDLGANTGEFSRLAAAKDAEVVAWDFDQGCVERNWAQVRGSGQRILPLVLDLTNPSPSIGWAGEERRSFAQRGPVDAVLALAVVHHLAIGNNVPLDRIAEFFSRLGRHLIVEFVPKEDSQTQRLLASRKDVFPTYTQQGFEQAFSERFSLVSSVQIPGTLRTLYHYRTIGSA